MEVGKKTGILDPGILDPNMPRITGATKKCDVCGGMGMWKVASSKASLGCNAEQISKRLVVAGNGWLIPPSRFSDQAAFWDIGVAGVMLTDTSWYRNPNSHTAADTVDTLDLEFMAEIVAGVFAFIHEA